MAEPKSECHCYRCLTESGETLPGTVFPITCSIMVVCAICGNKRCPHGTDHRLACTDSNAPGQPGSRYSDDWTPPLPKATQ